MFQSILLVVCSFLHITISFKIPFIHKGQLLIQQKLSVYSSNSFERNFHRYHFNSKILHSSRISKHNTVEGGISSKIRVGDEVIGEIDDIVGTVNDPLVVFNVKYLVIRNIVIISSYICIDSIKWATTSSENVC